MTNTPKHLDTPKLSGLDSDAHPVRAKHLANSDKAADGRDANEDPDEPGLQERVLISCRLEVQVKSVLKSIQERIDYRQARQKADNEPSHCPDALRTRTGGCVEARETADDCQNHSHEKQPKAELVVERVLVLPS